MHPELKVSDNIIMFRINNLWYLLREDQLFQFRSHNITKLVIHTICK